MTWSQRNARRVELIAKKISTGLTEGEDDELGILQNELFSRQDAIHPLPIGVRFFGNAENEQHYGEYENANGRANVGGWITDEGVIFFCVGEPKFCPETGQKLIMFRVRS